MMGILVMVMIKIEIITPLVLIIIVTAGVEQDRENGGWFYGNRFRFYN